MNRIPVISSNVKSIGFEDGVLEVEFHHGNVYQYMGVPEHVYNDFMNSDSKGRFVHKHLKDRYTTIRIS